MSSRPTPDIVFLGNLLVDDVVLEDGRTRMGEAGGAILYASLGARLWGAAVGVVSVAGSDYPAAALSELEARGVDLSGVRRLDRPGVRTWLLYERAVRRVIHRIGCPSHREVSPKPGDLPAAFMAAKAFHLAPMPFAVQAALVAEAAARPGAMVSLDPHRLVREDSLEEWRELLASVDAFFPSEDEFQLDHAAEDPRGPLARLDAGRLRHVAFKRGSRGGILRDCSRGDFIEWRPVEVAVVDTTGAGDAFAGGFLAGLVSGKSRERAIDQGAVAASFAVEGWGTLGLLAASPDAAEQRLQSWLAARVGR